MPTPLFQKGNPGKPKGAKNKFTKTVKETVLEVFNTLQEEDGPASLRNWAVDQPTEFYKIAAKLIPTDIKADVKTTSKIALQIVRANNHPDSSNPSPEPTDGTE